MKINKKSGSCLFIAIFSLVAGSCGVNPVTGERELSLVSESQEISYGKENYIPAQQSQGGPYVLDKELTDYVSYVGKRLAKVSDRPKLPYEFVVLNNSVPNAWALPGGKIAINRGLLLELRNEAELAAVLGHEIVHSAARHGAQRIERGMLLNLGVAGIGLATSDTDNSELILGASALGANLILQKYGRGAELESDEYGIKYMVKAGYNPNAAVSLQDTFVKLSKGREANWLEGLFASHPPSQERVNKNRMLAKKYGSKGELGEQRYLKKIAGLKKTRPAYDSFEKGRKALSDKNTDEALRLAQAAIASYPEEALFYSLEGEAWMVKKQYQKAEQSFTKAMSHNDALYLFPLQRGLALKAQNKLPSAKSDLQASLDLQATAMAYLKLGDIARISGENNNSQNYYKKAISMGGAAGNRAQIELACLVLPRSPARYLKVEMVKAKSGVLLLKVQNNAPIAVDRLSIDVSINARSKETVSTRESIAPGKSTMLNTGIPVVADAKYQAEIQRVSVVSSSCR